MTSLFLILAYLGCVSSGAMLSMLLFLVFSYLSASLWLIYHKVIYTGLLYILVYVGAIVVLIMFVVQLTNTSLTGDQDSNFISTPLMLIQNTILILSVSLFTLMSLSYLTTDTWSLHLSLINLTEINWTESYLSYSLNEWQSKSVHNLSLLAFSIFNEYSYSLILSVHAIILAILGPIKLAISDLTQNSN